MRVTSVPRTLLDLAGVLSADELSQAFQVKRNAKVKCADGITREADFLIGDVWIEIRADIEEMLGL